MILVTGATGQLGSHVLFELAMAGKKVRALYRDEIKINFAKELFTVYKPDNPDLFNLIEWFKADINDYHALTESMQDVTHVFHCAGVVSFNTRDRKEINHVNIDGTSKIVNACLEAHNIKLCHVSSVAALGDIAFPATVNEEVIWNRGSSASGYAISKFKGEMEVWRGINEGLDAIIINPSVIIGPWMWQGPGKQLFRGILQGLNYYPAGSTGFVDVRDVARIMVLLSVSNITGERFIVNAENMNHREFMNLLAHALDRKEPKYPLTPFLTGIAVILEAIRAFLTGSSPRVNRITFKITSEKLNYSNEKISRKLDFNFIPIANSVKDTARLFKKNQ